MRHYVNLRNVRISKLHTFASVRLKETTRTTALRTIKFGCELNNYTFFRSTPNYELWRKIRPASPASLICFTKLNIFVIEQLVLPTTYSTFVLDT